MKICMNLLCLAVIGIGVYANIKNWFSLELTIYLGAVIVAYCDYLATGYREMEEGLDEMTNRDKMLDSERKTKP
jgi:deoxycytidylate deaminase